MLVKIFFRTFRQSLEIKLSAVEAHFCFFSSPKMVSQSIAQSVFAQKFLSEEHFENSFRFLSRNMSFGLNTTAQIFIKTVASKGAKRLPIRQ